MKVTTVPRDGNRLRLLVAIASYGDKNLGFLKRVIRNYLSMPMAVDVVVFSNQPKDLERGVKVIVGLPSKNPWSLPFAHKTYFAENVERYDLFIYSEDDMEVTEQNIRAFLRVTPELEPTEIAGFLRYETDGPDDRSFPEIHGPFHWRPESVRRRGACTVAEFSNEHAAFYLLTREQLRRAIASGGFLREPCESRYDMLCTAATDPYTNCSFRKVICISALDDFIIHHLSNRYADQWGLKLPDLKEQVKTLMEISNRDRHLKTICGKEGPPAGNGWTIYYERSCVEVLETVPADAKTILSIGCGWGATEAELAQRGASVTAIPLDSLIGVTARRRGLEVLEGTLEECLGALKHRKFDCVLVANLLHMPPHPTEALEQRCQLISRRGTLVVGGPNFSRLPRLFRRVLGVGEFAFLSSKDRYAASRCNPRNVIRRIRNAGFRSTAVRWINHSPLRWRFLKVRRPLGSLTADNWVVQARRDS